MTLEPGIRFVDGRLSLALVRPILPIGFTQEGRQVSLLLPSQKAEIFDALLARAFEPSLFRWYTYADQNYGRTEVLEVSDTAWRFEFLQDDRGRNFCEFSPGAHALRERRAPGTWAGQIACLDDWLAYLRREIGTLDPWAELERYRLPVRAERPSGIPDAPFTPDQLTRIEEAVAEIRARLLEDIEDSSAHRRMVDDYMTYLVDAAHRQGRRDWMHTLIGVLVTVSFSVGLAPERAVELWHLATRTLSGLLDLLPRLPAN